jgi:hypothetical protein
MNGLTKLKVWRKLIQQLRLERNQLARENERLKIHLNRLSSGRPNWIKHRLLDLDERRMFTFRIQVREHHRGEYVVWMLDLIPLNDWLWRPFK